MASIEYCTNMFNNGMVLTFCNAVVLRGIINSEFLLCSLRLEIWLKLCRHIFSSSIWMKDFDSYIMLGFTHCIEGFIGHQNFWFINKKINMSPLWVVIDKCHIIVPSLFSFNLSRSLHIRVYFFTKYFCSFTLLDFGNQYPSHLAIGTKLTEEISLSTFLQL